MLTEARVVDWAVWSDPARVWLRATYAVARARGHLRVHPFHMLHAAVHDEKTAALFPNVTDEVRSAVDAAVASLPVAIGEPFANIELCRVFQRAIDAARAADAKATVNDLATTLLDVEDCINLFDNFAPDINEAPRDPRTLPTDARPLAIDDDPATDAPPTATLGVVIHNDDVTAIDLVTDALELAFGYSEEDAQRMAARIDEHGEAAVRYLPREEAIRCARLVVTMARNEGFPLRVTLCAVGGDR